MFDSLSSMACRLLLIVFFSMLLPLQSYGAEDLLFHSVKIPFGKSSLVFTLRTNRERHAQIGAFDPDTGLLWIADFKSGSTFSFRKVLELEKASSCTAAEAVVGDINADGSDELLLAACPERGKRAIISFASDRALVRWHQSPVERLEGVLFADVNGDGAVDLIERDARTGDWYVAQFKAASITKYHLWGRFPSGQLATFTVVDLNRDEIPDIASLEKVSGTWWGAVAVPEKSKFKFRKLVFPGLKNPVGDKFLQDLNSDNIPDSIEFDSREGEWWVHVSQNGTFVRQPWASFPRIGRWSNAIVANFDGDQKSDFLSRAENGKHWWILLGGDLQGSVLKHPAHRAMSQIKSGFVVSDVNGDQQADLLVVDFEKENLLVQLFSKTLLKKASFRSRPELLEGKICLGYRGDGEQPWGRTWFNCPSGMAVLSADDPGSDDIDGPKKPISGICCPMPKEDVLTENHVETSTMCPSQYVATSGVYSDCQTCEKKFRCTKINTKRYQLGSVTKGLYWGAGHSRWGEKNAVDKRRIPLAIRHAVGRVDKEKWDRDGCVGYPWGSYLVGKTDKLCQGFAFSQLQYSGAEGDPGQGTPVQIFPHCRRLKSKFDPGTTCAY